MAEPLGERRRIAMVAASPFPFPQGSQVLIGQLAAALARRGHAVRLLTYASGLGQPPSGVRVERIPALPGLGPVRGPLSPQKPVLDLLLARALLRLVRDWPADVLHAHNVEGLAAALIVQCLTGVPAVYHVHNAMGLELPTYFRSRAGHWLGGLAGRWLDGHLPRRAAGCIVLSEGALPYFRARGAERVALIPPGIDLEPGDAQRVRRRLGDGPLVLYAGNLDRYQDLELLFGAFSRVAAARPEARLVLSTNGRPAAWPDRAAALGIGARTLFIPAADFSAVRDLLAAADVAVCPRRTCLGLPIKLLNYMAAGRPIVVSAGSACGLRHMENAWLVPNGDLEAMAGAILALLGDPALAVRLGEAARRTAEAEHDWEQVIERIEAVYDQVRDSSSLESRKPQRTQRAQG